MRHLKASFALGSVATALLAAPGFAAAAIPTGSFEIGFGGLQSIWSREEDGVDFGEEFCSDFTNAFDLLEFCDLQVFLDGKGKIFGSFEFSGWSGGLHFDEAGTVKGTQKGDDRSGISRVSLTIKLTGVASDGSATARTKSSLRYSGQTTADGFLSGVWDQSVCIQGFQCNVSQSPVPPTTLTNGGWSLELEINDGGGGALGGSARVEFGGGSDCFYAVSGKYSAKKDMASLSLLPAESECAGTSLKLNDVRLSTGSPDAISGSIAYGLFGFKGATSFGDLPVSSAQDALENHDSNQQFFSSNFLLQLVDPREPPAQSGASATVTVISVPPQP